MIGDGQWGLVTIVKVTIHGPLEALFFCRASRRGALWGTPSFSALRRHPRTRTMTSTYEALRSEVSRKHTIQRRGRRGRLPVLPFFFSPGTHILKGIHVVHDASLVPILASIWALPLRPMSSYCSTYQRREQIPSSLGKVDPSRGFACWVLSDARAPALSQPARTCCPFSEPPNAKGQSFSCMAYPPQ